MFSSGNGQTSILSTHSLAAYERLNFYLTNLNLKNNHKLELINLLTKKNSKKKMKYGENSIDEAADHHMDLSGDCTTIDSSVIQSRIRQSTSIQKEVEQENSSSSVGQQQQQPVFGKISAAQASGNKIEYRRVRVPPHRYTPLREHWEQVLTPLVEYLKLQVCWKLCVFACAFGMLIFVFLLLKSTDNTLFA